MSELRVLRMGDPLLHRVAEPVTRFGTSELCRLVDDLWDTMAVEGGIGLAAPQVGVNLRLVIFGLDAEPGEEIAPEVPRTVLINPTLEPLDDARENGWEGCLSLPGLRGLVARPSRIAYSGFDLQGQPIRREAHGFHARVVQHECDHLDGILYPQRMTDMASFVFQEEMAVAGRLVEPPC